MKLSNHKTHVQPRPNTAVEGTACKLRLQVPSALRAPAAGYLERWAPYA